MSVLHRHRIVNKLLKTFPALLLAPVVALLCSAPVAAAQLPSLEEIVALPNPAGSPPSAPVWSPDGGKLAFLWNERGFPFRDIYVVDSDGATPRRLTTMDPEADQLKPFGEHFGEDLSLAALTAASNRRHAGGVSEILWDPQGDRILFVFRGDIYAVPAAGGSPQPLIRSSGGKSSVQFSPDGRFLSFLQGGDLWLQRFDGNYLTQATHVGQPSINTVPVGAYLTRDVEYRRYSWSPDSRFIAMEYVDRRNVTRMPVPSYLHDEPLLHEVRRGYPGESDEIREVGIYHLRDGQVRHLALAEPTHRTIMDLEWSPAANELLIHQDTYDGEHRWIFVANGETGAIREVHTDYRPRRIYSLFSATWSSDGKNILFIGDSDEHYRIYSIAAGGGKPRILTRGNYDVSGGGFGNTSLVVSRQTREIFFVSSQHSPYERPVYRIAEGGGEPVRITQLAGMHDDFVPSPDGRRLATIASNDTTPPALYLLASSGREPERAVTAAPAAFASYPLGTPRYVTFPSRIDDFTLHARFIEPPNLDPGKKYPVVIGHVYSGTVRNQWLTPRPISLLQHKMAVDGDYIIVQVDLRGSVGYGVPFREAFQGDWGGGDLEDLHSTVDYLKTLPYVDSDRIGIWGNSYGGMMVLFALFERPGMFAAGISGSPAIDVHYFTQNDQHLSRRPQTHPETFDKSTLLNYGEKLQDPLMFIHGLHDDIVPFHTTAKMMEKLMLLGLDFEQVIPMQSAHWWAYPEHYAVHTFRRFMQFIDRHVGPGAR